METGSNLLSPPPSCDARDEHSASVVAKRTGAWRGFLADVLGSLGDLATLVPLLLAASLAGLVQAAPSLMALGVLCMVVAVQFRVPMPVQPLKAVTIMALSSHASRTEFRAASLAIGIAFCALSFSAPLKRLASAKFEFIHGVQISLAGLLFRQSWIVVKDSTMTEHAELVAFVVLLFMLGKRSKLPILGLIALATLIASFVHPAAARAPSELADSVQPVRWELVAWMVASQLPLTLGNSVFATSSAAQAYFGAQASRVTLTRLAQSIGVGNMVFAAMGFLPFCHGSGGLTAHVRAGARRYRATVITGIGLVSLGFIAFATGSIPKLPRFGVATMLAMTALFHIELVRDGLKDRATGLPLIGAFLGTLFLESLPMGLFVWAVLRALARLFALRKAQSVDARRCAQSPNE